MILYLSIAQVLQLHRRQLALFGGSGGLRDRGGLEAAVARPRMTFGGEDLYPDHAAKAAALLHSLVMNHPFVDGNKRTSLLALYTFLGVNGVDFIVPEAEAAAIILSLAAGEVSEESLTRWIRDNWPSE